MQPEFRYSDLLPIGADDTPYRLLTTDGVSTFEAGGRTFLSVKPSALRLLTAEAMHDIAHYLRPAHLRQLRRIIDDPESSANDRFVALDLLKNVNISAGVPFAEKLAHHRIPAEIARNIKPLRSALEYAASHTHELQVSFFLRVQ